jgi:tRNA pseudouridine38-40 synthase
MRNIKLIIEYDGTEYAGWQIQKNALAIQEVIEASITKLTGEKVEVVGSSRTDAGVHAIGYTANFKTESSIPSDKFTDALNTKLPKDIVILSSVEVPLEFHSRYDSVGKTYCYTVINRMQPSAVGRNYSYHMKFSLNVEKMREACKYFLGTHDFSALKNMGSSTQTSIRTITDLRIDHQGDIIRIYCTADGFLYNMMRIITGVLLQVGTGKFKPEEVEAIILSKDRKRAGKSVPASGLCLMEVFY